MKDKEELDEMRRRIQGAISQAKRDELRDKYGMLAENIDPSLPFEVENEWLGNLLEFERQLKDAKPTTVRQQIGDPPIKPLNELPLYSVRDALESFLELLADFWIAVDFLGDWDDAAAYAYLTKELLDEETMDIRIEGTWSVFTPSTPKYDVQMWVEEFVMDLFMQEREYFLSGLDKQPLYNMAGEAITADEVRQQIEAVWLFLPATKHFSVEPITVQADHEEGAITAVISWREDDAVTEGIVESFFRLQPSPYTGWDVVQTSLLDDLQSFFEA